MDNITFIKKTVSSLMTRNKIPGMSLCLVRDGKMVYAKGFGLRNLESRLPATPKTLYGIGSCTKSFTALSIIQLVEKGKISLDDPVSKYAPLKIGIPNKEITIHHLLSHSSGIPSLGTSTILRSGLHIPMSSWEDHYRFVNGAQEEIADEPGKRFFYLNAGYAVLQDILQRTSKMRLDDYVEKNILRPLKMKRSTYSKKSFVSDPDRMASYTRGEEGLPKPSEPVIHELLFGRGGLICPVTELANYLIANIDKGRFQDVELISPELMEEMHKIHIEAQRGWHGRQGYGYGWSIIEDFLGRKLVMHGGSISVSGGHLSFMPEEKIGVAMGYNMLGFPSMRFVQMLYAILLGECPEEVLPFLGIRERMKMLAGRYETYMGINGADVVYKNGLLYLEQKTRQGKSVAPLIPDGVNSSKFYILSDGEKMPVKFDVSPHKIDMYVKMSRFHKRQ